MFSSLSNYNYRLFFSGGLVSQMGTWMQNIAQPWLVLEMTHSPLALGAVTALQMLPVLLLALFAGVFVDRWPKQRLLLITQSAMLVQAGLLGFLTVTGLIQLWELYILALALGFVTALDNPTRQAFVMELVGRDKVVNAIGLNSAMFNGSRLVGPAVAGAIIAAWGVSVCFFVNAASFLAVLVSILMMHSSEFYMAPRRDTSGQRVLGQMAEGLRFVFSRPDIVTVVILVAGIGCFGFNWGTAIPLLATQALHTGATGYGALMTGFGFGALLAALVTASAKTSERKLLLAAGAFSLVYFASGFAPWFALTFGLLVLLGAAAMSFAPAANSTMQLKSPDHLRGRVMGLYTMLMAGSTPIGALFTGFLANAIGIRLTIGVEAVICLASVVVALMYRARTGASRPDVPAPRLSMA